VVVLSRTQPRPASLASFGFSKQAGFLLHFAFLRLRKYKSRFT
jgi:hypothetical protein